MTAIADDPHPSPRLPARGFPFRCALHIADDDHAYIVDRPARLPGLGGLVGVSLMFIYGLIILILGIVHESSPDIFMGAVLVLASAAGAGICGWILHRAMRNTRRLDIVGTTAMVTVSWLDWRGRVWRQIDAPASQCELRLHAILVEDENRRNRRTREIPWRALVLHAAGEEFVLAVQGSKEALQAYIRQLPRTLKQATVIKGAPITARFRRTISKRGKAEPSKVETGVTGSCMGCGYDLSGLPLDHQRCPECGTRRLA